MTNGDAAGRTGGSAQADSVWSVRVLLDVSAVPGEPRGAGRYVVELARHLARLDDPGLELVLLARRGDRARWEALAASEATAGTAVVGVSESVPSSRPARLVWEQVAGPCGRRPDRRSTSGTARTTRCR